MLSEEARGRLEDLVELQPTKNAELQERWGMESGSEVHGYLEDELREYYYRDEESRIRATAEAVELVVGESGGAIEVSAFEAAVIEAVPDHDQRAASVVAVFHELDVDAEVGRVRRTLQRLRRRSIVEVDHRTVPVFRLAVAREDLDIEVVDGADEADRREDAAAGSG